MPTDIVVNARFLTQRIAGVQRFAIELAQRLKPMAPEIRFVAPGRIYHQELARELGAESFGRFHSHFWEQLELPRYLRRHGSPLLVNLCSTAPLSYPNQIVSIHDAIFYRHPEWFSRSFATWYNFLLPRISRKSRRVITVSHHAKQDLCDALKIPPEKVEVVYNSVSRSFLKLSAGVVPKKKYILSVSSLDPRKNFENLIRAYLQLEPTEYELVIIGAEARSFPKHQLFSVVSNHPRIRFTGYVTDEELVRYYQEASLFVYPSLYEGFGIPPLEAMACGTPVIASNNTSIPEVCSDAALLVDATSPSDIAARMREVLGNPTLQETLIRRGHRRVQDFSWESSCRKLLEVIQSVHRP